VVTDIAALKLLPEDKDVVTFVILESADSSFYVKVKKFFDDRSLTSQCLQSKKAFAKGMNIQVSYGMNVCYKINSKLFGVNATVGPQSPLCPVGESPPIMVLGYDCHHPPVGVTSGSMGCCVASLDGT
jgi:eukaryotic translation initiation factor 2C